MIVRLISFNIVLEIFAIAVTLHGIYMREYNRARYMKTIGIVNLIMGIRLIDSVSDIVLQVNKPYLMTVFSYIEPYLDLADFSTMLSSIWTYMEFPSACPDVTLSKMIHYFQQADPKILMDDADYKMYQDLPEVVTVYRGVGDSIDGKSGNPKGLSYTTSYETAEWFSNRFGTGYVVKLEIPKERVLACFEGNESEVVVNTSGLDPIRMDMELALEEDMGGIL